MFSKLFEKSRISEVNKKGQQKA
jgi:hypothetical protein